MNNSWNSGEGGGQKFCLLSALRPVLWHFLMRANQSGNFGIPFFKIIIIVNFFLWFWGLFFRFWEPFFLILGAFFFWFWEPFFFWFWEAVNVSKQKIICPLITFRKCVKFSNTKSYSRRIIIGYVIGYLVTDYVFAEAESLIIFPKIINAAAASKFTSLSISPG